LVDLEFSALITHRSDLSGWFLLMELEPSVDFLLLGCFYLTDFQGCSSGIELNRRFVSAHGTGTIDLYPVSSVLFCFTDLHSCSSVIELNSEMNASFGGNCLPF
jgi:hypothetical protein